MSGAEILSLVGIIIGLAVLVVLVMKGINIYVVAFIASIIVAVFGRMNLYEALKTGEIAAAGLDVLCEEPMSETNPLVKIKDSRKLIITPHIAWASVEARTRLMQIIVGQIKEFFAL